MKLGSELALQVDLAAAVIAVLALLFSIRAGMRQRRQECETLHLQCNSDIIAWSNVCLAGLCQGEMLLRPERRSLGSRVLRIDHRDRKIVEMTHVAGGYGGPSAGGNPGDLGVPKAGWTTSLPAISLDPRSMQRSRQVEWKHTVLEIVDQKLVERSEQYSFAPAFRLFCRCRP